MPVRIRLQRHGKKGKPFYWIVAADSRAKRDGRYLENIGTYNPNTNPATVELNVDQAVKWLENGAQPSDTARTLLSYRGAMLKHHLNGGVKKGAFSQEEADKKFSVWLEEKQAKINSKIDGLDKDKAADLAQRLEAEKAVNQKRINEMTTASETEESVEGDTEQANEVAAETDQTTPSETQASQEEIPVEESAESSPPAEESKAEETSENTVPAEESKAEETSENTVPAEEPNVDETAQDSAPAEEPKAEEAKSEDTTDEKEESKE